MTFVTIVRTIEADLEAVFAAFVTPDKIALWWGPDEGPVISAEIDARVGGRFHIRFRLSEDGSEHGSNGTFEVFDPPMRLGMSWAWDNDVGPPSRLDVTFRAVATRTGVRTEVVLIHSHLDDTKSRDRRSRRTALNQRPWKR